MKSLKTLFFFYQRVMWYAAQTKAEYGKVGSWITETITLGTLLIVKGIRISWWQIIIGYIVLLILASLVGVFLVKIGVTKYTTKLGNEQNPELQEIKESLRIVKNYLGISDK